MPRLIIHSIGKLYTLAGLDGTSGRAATGIQPVTDGEIAAEDGLITYAGPRRSEPEPLLFGPHAARQPLSVPERADNPYPPPPVVTRPTADLTVVDARGGLATPGLIDPHTHVVFAGHRAAELNLLLKGASYLDILAAGGGILSTVDATRAASDEALLESATVRLETMLRMGATSVEIKTGYGLSTDQELRLLAIIGELADRLPLTVVPTFLGAHAVPRRLRDRPDAYVEEIVHQMIPAVAKQGIARFCDVFCERGVFSLDQSRRILEAAQHAGLPVKLHADEIEPPEASQSGARLAAELGAVSADHLRMTGSDGMEALAEAGVAPILLPATTFNLREGRYADARGMIDAFDLPVALATDDNPGTSPTESLQMVMTLAALEMRLTPEEILAAVTVNAARAVGLQDQTGSLEPGKLADAVLWQTYALETLSYRFGVNQAALVVKAGVVISPTYT